jgi:hypothetical protein
MNWILLKHFDYHATRCSKSVHSLFEVWLLKIGEHK